MFVDSIDVLLVCILTSQQALQVSEGICLPELSEGTHLGMLSLSHHICEHLLVFN